MEGRLQDIYLEKFGKKPEMHVFSPGRANIIGEHTDYNDGFVLPFAIEQGITFLASTNQSFEIRLYAADVNESCIFDLNALSDRHDYGWTKYIYQAIMAMGHHHLQGMDVVFGGNLPIGAGVSSSSALICGFLTVLSRVSDVNMSQEALVEMSVTAERGQGLRGGIMDQFSIFHGMQSKAILLDCKDYSSVMIDMLQGDYTFYLFNTNVKHNLVKSDYNTRRDECDQAVDILNKSYKPIQSLRDLTVTDIEPIQSLLPSLLWSRASFVIEENDRVHQAVKAMQSNDAVQLGALLYASHEGLSKKYEVSCPELDYLVEMTLGYDQILGARMMGGGFGGCTINLVDGVLSTTFCKEIDQKFTAHFGHHPDIFSVYPSDGIFQKLRKFDF